MAFRLYRARMYTEEVVDHLLNDADDPDIELDDPGRDDELGFEELELEGDEETMYGIILLHSIYIS